MFEKLFGPKHTFKDALLVLEQGLRSGEITLKDEPEVASSVNAVELYVPLLNEGTDVLRPTTGLLLGPDLVQVLATKDYNPTTEKWQFPPGSKVRCVSETRGGRKLLVARQRID